MIKKFFYSNKNSSEELVQRLLRKLLKVEKNINICQLSANFCSFKLFFEMFSELPKWFTNLWILVVASIYGIKGTQIFKNGGKK